MSLNLAPTPRQWAYAQLCRRWFTHYPDPFLAETSNHIAARARIPDEHLGALDWMSDWCFGDVARGYSKQYWPMPSSRYWERLSCRRYWRTPKLSEEEQRTTLMLAETLIASGDGFSHASAVHARQGLEHLPDDIPAPTILVYADGCAAFWWQARHGQAVFVKFLPDGGLHYQYFNGDDDPVGRCPRWKGMIDGWNPGWPQGILDTVRVLYGGETRRS